MGGHCSGKSVGGICEEDGRILMIYRRYEPYGWACPAGHVEEGENVHETLVKEFDEEVGLKIVGMEQLLHKDVPWNNCHRSKGSGHTWWVFKAFCVGEVKVSEEETRIDPKTGKSWGWFTRQELKYLELEPVWRHWFLKLGYIFELKSSQ